ncbi:DeoR/GlpR family DNA-binding transcription regulator [Companilactobacillus halodurans]|uniref:DeoR/GlpR transcriptional regulator n=1 Tax=Companilactobacillus halodurans TaxID=2584183 RepID=A0A5P0ZXL4_9LACO|nr:DeoR/GlpR family DNA-binding transcription regulator [Companilactobacillus halodurans]MQS75192.1 DeoR/GlpR transcriptional regulator [Companilactobacillus halodurans]MQS97542.1 DeoR/GlpR transcriptional regulator [Companilactobacillus halodurans]
MIPREKREAQIMEKLESDGWLSTKQIADYFNVAFDTARRDILHLTSTGQALRVHGGIMVNTENEVPEFLNRKHILSPVKSEMAKIAASYILPGRLYFIGSSTTLVQLCDLLGQVDTTIVTHGIDNAEHLMANKFPKIELLGGVVDRINRYASSLDTLVRLNDFVFDGVFIGASRITDEGDITVMGKADAAILRKAIQRGKKIVLVTQEYKFTTTKTSPYVVTNCQQVDVLITDKELNPKFKTYFRDSAVFRVIKNSK